MLYFSKNPERRPHAQYNWSMTTAIKITDDFDIEKIAKSGQCFRMKKINHFSKSEDECRAVSKCENPIFCNIASGHYIEIQKSNDTKNEWLVSCTKKEFDDFWKNYFDLGRSYRNIRKNATGQNGFVDMTLDYGKGLRILKQDPWEMIVTFIISQRRSMPAIATAVDKICTLCGEELQTQNECTIKHSFPTPEALLNLTESDIRNCGVGYRAPYILDAAKKVSSEELDLELCKKLDDDELFSKLCTIKGVGTKVANCIMLFGFSRTKRAPVDVWIQRVIDQDFKGVNPFSEMGENAGIIQQYFFFYKTQNKK